MVKTEAVLLLVGFVAVVNLNAQDLDFVKTTHDFGDVKEESGPVVYSFDFVNTSKDTLLINSVNASCGCTTPDWSKEAVAPGDSGFITAQYDPLNRPGKFKKSLTVDYVLGANPQTKSVFIEGLVQPKPKTVEDELPTVMGALRVKYKAFNMGKITNNEASIHNFDVYNESDSVVSWLADKSQIPDFMEVSFVPETLEPKTMGVVSLKYDVGAKNDLGFVTDNIVLFTSEPVDSMKEFHVIATIEEYFPPMTPEELSVAPKLVFDKTQLDFGRVTGGNKVVGTFTMTNKGKSDLIIRKTKTNCGCTLSKPAKTIIAPGEQVELEVSFDTAGRRGRQYKTVTVFTNDPTASSQMISIKADVQTD
ncbi:MAG: DUF1573 domain-containing protein [Marinoscillum sp.]